MSTRGGSTCSTIGYPEPGGLCGKGKARSCDELETGVMGEGTGFMRLGEGGTPRRLSVDCPANDCSDPEVVRVVELDVRDMDTVEDEGRVGLGGGSYRTDEYRTADCCSTHSTVRPSFCTRFGLVPSMEVGEGRRLWYVEAL